MTLSELLKNARASKMVERPVSLDEAAKASGIPYSTLDYLENRGTKMPSDETIEKLIKYYPITREEIVKAAFEI